MGRQKAVIVAGKTLAGHNSVKKKSGLACAMSDVEAIGSGPDTSYPRAKWHYNCISEGY